MSIDEFFEYLCTQQATRELAWSLAEAYDLQARTRALSAHAAATAARSA